MVFGFVIAKLIQGRFQNALIAESELIIRYILQILPLLIFSQFVAVPMTLSGIIGIVQILIASVTSSRCKKHHVNIMLNCVTIIGCFIAIYIEICKIIAEATYL
jgi:hypothetical protein